MQTPTHESGRLAREREQGTVTCPRCGTANDTEARWCIHCAVRLGPSAIPAPAPAVPPTRSKWPFRAVAAAALVLLLTSTFYTLAVFAPEISPIHPGVTDTREVRTERQIQQVGTRFSINLTNYDYRAIPEWMRRLRSDTSPDFDHQFQTGINGTLTGFASVISQDRVTSTAELKAASITSRDSDTATLLVVLSQTTRSTKDLAPVTQIHLLELTLVKTSKGWKVDNVANAVSPRG